MPTFRFFVALVVGFVATAILGTGTALALEPAPDPAVPAGIPASTGGGSSAMVSHPGSPLWVFVVVAAITMLVTAVVTYVATGRRRVSEQLI